MMIKKMYRIWLAPLTEMLIIYKSAWMTCAKIKIRPHIITGMVILNIKMVGNTITIEMIIEAPQIIRETKGDKIIIGVISSIEITTITTIISITTNPIITGISRKTVISRIRGPDPG